MCVRILTFSLYFVFKNLTIASYHCFYALNYILKILVRSCDDHCHINILNKIMKTLESLLFNLRLLGNGKLVQENVLLSDVTDTKKKIKYVLDNFI